MHSNLSIAMAQEHRHDLQREVKAAKLARPETLEPSGDPSPRSTRKSWVGNVRTLASNFAVRTPAPRRMT